MIKFLDLHKINSRFRDAFEEAFKKSLDTSNFILGPNVSSFENEFAAYCGARHCIGTANGLDALTLILRAYIHLGKLEKGDKVIVPANTFIATILAVLHADLEPVFVEPNPETYNLTKAVVSKALTAEVKAVIVVHLYGQLADTRGLKSLCDAHELLLIADAAQAHGAQRKNARAGNLSDAAAFSFYPSKNLGALGDGGAVTTNNAQLSDTIRLLHNYGSKIKYSNEILGYNSRLDDTQAAFLRVKLKHLDADNARRQAIAKQYISGICNARIKLPNYSGGKDHVFYAFVIEVCDRDDFINFLNANAIGWLIHYPIAPHHQPALQRFSGLNLPITEKIHKRIISLPLSPVMTDREVHEVITVLNTY